jgi:hypothetical protein
LYLSFVVSQNVFDFFRLHSTVDGPVYQHDWTKGAAPNATDDVNGKLAVRRSLTGQDIVPIDNLAKNILRAFDVACCTQTDANAVLSWGIETEKIVKGQKTVDVANWEAHSFG